MTTTAAQCTCSVPEPNAPSPTLIVTAGGRQALLLPSRPIAAQEDWGSLPEARTQQPSRLRLASGHGRAPPPGSRPGAAAASHTRVCGAPPGHWPGPERWGRGGRGRVQHPLHDASEGLAPQRAHGKVTKCHSRAEHPRAVTGGETRESRARRLLRLQGRSGSPPLPARTPCVRTPRPPSQPQFALLEPKADQCRTQAQLVRSQRDGGPAPPTPGRDLE